MRSQPTPVLPVHTWLYSHTQLQRHRQIRWRNNDETAYRAEVSTLTKWCQENHLSLNIDKTKELVVDFRRQSREHTPISFDKTPVERVNSFKFLGVHMTEDLTWSAHTDAVLKKSHQRLFFLRRLRKFGMNLSILRSFYTCTVESILTGCITTWFGNSIAGNRKALQRVVRTARHIVGGELPSLQDIYTRRCIRKARRIINDPATRPTDCSPLLPSGRCLRSIRSRTSRLRDSFFPSGYQANEQSELIHPTAPLPLTICHALHFNSTVQTGLHVHNCTNTTVYLLPLDTIQCTYMTFAYPAYVQSTAPLHITVYVYMCT